jgi:hypothetical protein
MSTVDCISVTIIIIVVVVVVTRKYSGHMASLLFFSCLIFSQAPSTPSHPNLKLYELFVPEFFITHRVALYMLLKNRLFSVLLFYSGHLKWLLCACHINVRSWVTLTHPYELSFWRRHWLNYKDRMPMTQKKNERKRKNNTNKTWGTLRS